MLVQHTLTTKGETVSTGEPPTLQSSLLLTKKSHVLKRPCEIEVWLQWTTSGKPYTYCISSIEPLGHQ